MGRIGVGAGQGGGGERGKQDRGREGAKEREAGRHFHFGCGRPRCLPLNHIQDIHSNSTRKSDVPLIHESAASWALRLLLLVSGL